MHKKYNTEEFIVKAIKKHGNVYDYSRVNFIHTKKPVEIICKTHGVFLQIPNGHLNGYGCKKCATDINSKRKKYSHDVFIQKAILKHGNKFDYSLTIYKNSTSKIKIICPKHGVFEQRAVSHLLFGCNQCENNYISKKEFINNSSKTHYNKYDYTQVEYKTSASKVKIVCPEHGVFEQRAYHHMKGTGCPNCKTSNGVNAIKQILFSMNFEFITEHRFENCKLKNTLPFDFYLPNYNTCIEFDGEQHFKPMGYKSGKKKFEKTIKTDNIKNEFCKNNKINLFRINYKENVEKILINHILPKLEYIEV